MNSTRGSLWRKWDLHLHTPSSYDYKDNSVTNKEIVDILYEEGIELVAITDHHTIDVNRINELKEIAQDKITILPGIEFRSELGGSESIHFIAIFPENCNISTVWTKLQGKLNLTPEDINTEGHQNIICDLKDTCKLIHNLGGIVTIHAGSKTNTVENISNALDYKQAQKSKIVESIDIYEIGKQKDIIGYEEHVFPNINIRVPMILGSDNHNIRNYKVKDNCWIKADTTFNGLLQVLNEPKDRVFIGDIPSLHNKVNDNQTKYINYINIKKISEHYSEEKWFEDIQIPLNHELVAIIGNKGNGKSALADILCLAGNTKVGLFSFLNQEKFRKPPENKAKHFEAEITWFSGDKNSIILSNNPADYEVEKIQYVPQKYFEKLCNREDKELFENELKNVIFSHVPDDEKLNCNSIEELIEYRTNSKYEKINIIKGLITNINKEIVSLKIKGSGENKNKLASNLLEKENELKAHMQGKPAEMKEPKEDEKLGDKMKVSKIKIEEIKNELKDLNNKITIYENDRKETKLKISKIKSIEEKLNNFKTQYEVMIQDLDEPVKELNINIDELITFRVNIEKVNNKTLSLNTKLSDIEICLNGSEEKLGLYDKKDKLTKQIDELSNKLSEPQRKYEEYLTKINEWDKQKEKIEKEIEKYKNEIDYIKNKLKYDIEENRLKRKKKLKELFSVKVGILNIYKDIYQPVRSFIQEHNSSKPDYNVTFDVSLELNESYFKNHFFTYINQAKKGSFRGKEDGASKLNDVFINSEYDTEDSIISFIDTILENIEYDMRSEERDKVDFFSQIQEPIEFYDFLFSLNYLTPYYQLKLGKKNLSELSPGEKGALLLIFYLLIDKKEVPLVIDQPEENLDNQSVYQLLVPYIKEAKKRRQIIIVTHNPNLAVVCDAEQIIHAKIDKTQNINKVTYVSGAIENETINKSILDVLEGTLPAFNNRKIKYILSE